MVNVHKEVCEGRKSVPGIEEYFLEKDQNIFSQFTLKI